MKNLLKIKKRLILLLLLSSLFKYGYSTTYYVSTSGNNNNNGLTQTTPWQTLDYAQSHATAAGDIIALKKGDTWLLDNVLDISHGGSAGNIITWDGSLWGTGANAIIQSNSDGGSAPKYYSLVHIASCSYLTLQSITFNVNNKSRSGVILGASNATYGPTPQSNESYITIQDCSILNSGKTDGAWNVGLGVITWNTNISNLKIQRNTINGSDNHGIAFYNGRTDNSAPNPPKELINVYCGYNTITNTGRNNDGVYAGILVNNKITGITVEHNAITQGSSGHGFGIAVSSNEPTLGYFPTKVIIRYNDVRMAEPALWIENGQAKTIDIYYNKFYSSGGVANAAATIKVSASPSWTGAVINFYNNVMVGSATSNGVFSNEAGAAGICTFKNNIVINTATSGYGCVKLSLNTSTVHTNNSYYRNIAGDLNYQIVTSPYTEYKRSTAQAFEATSKIIDPLLSNLGGFDWTLQATSPCIGAGINIGLVSDYSGNTVNGTPSIGAYESGTSIVVPPPVAIPVFQNSAIANATPSLLELTYDLSLNNTNVPSASSFTAIVNSTVDPVSTVVISGTKVRLTLSSAIKYGDIVTIGYTKPATNPLQTTEGGQAASISGKSATNNVASIIKDGTPATISMTLSPYHVHRTVTVALQYTGTSADIQALSPETLTITDLNGKLYIIQSLVTGVKSLKIPLNLRSNIYNVNVLSKSVLKSTKRMMVY